MSDLKLRFKCVYYTNLKIAGGKLSRDNKNLEKHLRTNFFREHQTNLANSFTHTLNYSNEADRSRSK